MPSLELRNLGPDARSKRAHNNGLPRPQRISRSPANANPIQAHTGADPRAMKYSAQRWQIAGSRPVQRAELDER